MVLWKWKAIRDRIHISNTWTQEDRLREGKREMTYIYVLQFKFLSIFPVAVVGFIDFFWVFKCIWIKCAILQFSCNRRSFLSNWPPAFLHTGTSLLFWGIEIQLSTHWVHITIRSSQKLLNLKSQLLFPKKNWFVAEWWISFFLSSSTE